MMDEAEALPKKLRHIARSGNVTAVMDKRQETGRVNEGAADSSLSAKAAKSGVSVGTLRKVYKRGVAAWNSGHRPGTTPQQWGHARVNSYINKGKTYHTADKDLREETEDLDIDSLFEMQLMGTDEYRKHAIAMTPGQSQEIANAFTTTVKTDQKKTNEGSEGDCGCGGNCKCNDANGDTGNSTLRKFSEIRKDVKEAKEKDGKEDGVETEPTLVTKHKKGALKRPNQYDSTLQGLPVASRSNAYEEKKPEEKMMPTPRQVPAPPGGHPVPKGYKRVKDHIAGWKLVKEEDTPELTLEEAVQYHLDNQISITENVFRPGSEMFFDMIG